MTVDDGTQYLAAMTIGYPVTVKMRQPKAACAREAGSGGIII